MNRYILLSASLGLAAFATGCQNAGHAEADVDANRPVLAAETTTPYTVAYTARTDTPWFYSSTDTTAAGTLHSGDVVYLRSDSPTTGMVAARTTDGKIVYVRAADLRVQ